MILRITFAAVCVACQEPIEAGEMVSYAPAKRQYSHEECSEEGQTLASHLQESQAVDTDLHVPAPEGLSYLPYQRAGIAYANARKNSLLGDEMGLGKTVQALGLVNVCPQIERVCVVCPASLVLNWQIEAKRWLMRDVVFRVVPYSRLQPVAESKLAYDLLILDEAHFVKNPESQRSQHVFRLAKRCGRIVALTGTPLPDRPLDLWPLLLLLDPGTWEKFGHKRYTRRYCGGFMRQIGKNGDGSLRYAYDTRGASHLDELQKRVRTSCLVRRLKKDVLPELPEKRRQIIVLPNSAVLSELSYPGLPQDYDEAIAELRSGAQVPFERIAQARHDEGLRKVPFAVEHVERALDSGLSKILVFAHHEDILDKLELKLTLHGIVRLDGSTPIPERQRAIEQFQSNDGIRIFLGSLKAAGVGLTLTAASHVLFVENDWTPSTLSQAEDRAHRIGQRDGVLCTYLVLDGTIDARMMKLVCKKIEIIERVLAA